MAGQAALEAAGSICDIVRHHARQRGSCPAFTFGDETVTFAELDANANRVANALVALGVKRGERIAWFGRNHPFFFEALLGAARIGAVMTPVDWSHAAADVAYVLDHCGARVVFVGEGFTDALAGMRSLLPEVEQVIGIDAPDHAGTDYRIWRDGFPARPPAAQIGLGDDALQLYSSGNAERPRGAVFSHRAILACRDTTGRNGSGDWQRPAGREATLLAMPCLDAGGTSTGIAAIAAGTNAIVLPEFDADEVLYLIKNDAVSRLVLPPAALRALLDHPGVLGVAAGRLRHVSCDTLPMPGKLAREAIDVLGCGLVGTYGPTETAGPIVALGPEDHGVARPRRMRSAGRPLPGVEIRVIDADGHALPCGEWGEIATRSARNMSRYWNDPEATAATIDPAGWLRTGDAGCLDAEGRLHVRGRAGQRIGTEGHGPAPAGDEHVLRNHPGAVEMGF